MTEVYVKNNQALFKTDKYVYEVNVNCYDKGFFCIVNTSFFESPEIITNLVESYFVTDYIEISCELYSAPLDYIKENEYKLDKSKK